MEKKATTVQRALVLQYLNRVLRDEHLVNDADYRRLAHLISAKYPASKEKRQ